MTTRTEEREERRESMAEAPEARPLVARGPDASLRAPAVEAPRARRPNIWVPERADKRAGARAAFIPPWVPISFFLLVVVPTAIVGVYLALFASPSYRAEARFAVRGATEGVLESTAAGGVGGRIDSVITLSNTQEAYVVADYVASQGMLTSISERVDLRAIYGGPGLDFWNRLPATASDQDLLETWRRMTRATVDRFSGIVTLRVDAYSPDDAVTIARAVVDRTARVVDDLAERVRGDRIRVAEREVQAARERMRAALAEVEAYRSRQGVIDPVARGRDLVQAIETLRRDRIALAAELSAGERTLARDAPTVRVTRERLRSLDDEIGALEVRLGRETASRAPVSRDADAILPFERLQAEREFAQSQLLLAEAALVIAVTDAASRRIWLETFDPPHLPQQALSPAPVLGTLSAAFAALLFWSLLSLLYAGVREHDA